MSGSGHIFSMIASLKSNKRNKKSIFEKDLYTSSEDAGKIVDYKKMSSQQFLDFQKKLKEKERKRIIRVSILTTLITLFLIAIGIYFLFYFK